MTYHELAVTPTTYELGTEDGRVLTVPRVTASLSIVRRDLELIPPDVLEHAAARGRAAHAAVWLSEKGGDGSGLDVGSLHPEVAPYFQGYLAFKSATRVQIVETERLVVSVAFGYAGRMDLMAKGLTSRTSWDLIDLKSGAEHWSHALQVSGYAQAYAEMTGTKRMIHRWVLYLRENGTYRLTQPADVQARDFRAFCHVLGTYRLLMAHGGHHG